MAVHPPMQIDFVTLGMFIIDDIYPQNPTTPPHLNVPGGAGTYSALGARLLSPSTPSSVGWIIDYGVDFPPDLRSTINTWNTSSLWRPREEGAPTTRGRNGYSDGEHRDFRYLTTKKRLTAEDLTPELLASRSFHLICSPTRCVDLISRILALRRKIPVTEKPLMIWEPVPDLCIPSQLDNTYAALECVDVISPNHEELAALFAETEYATPPSANGDLDQRAVEQQAAQLLRRASNPGGAAVVVRCGKVGCYLSSSSSPSSSSSDKDKNVKWLPAYHHSPSKVIDPTGGGNGFLGGFAVGLVRTGGDVVEACRWGSVAASLCIAQVGVPVLTAGNEDGEERWNGCLVRERLEEFKERTR